MQLLPSGPMWDHWKAAAISYFESNEDPAECPLLQNPACPSIILHAIYTVLKLRTVVHGALWVALRESNPYTAVTTLDNHLARLRWEDCYAQHCRSVLLGELTPLEIWTECGPVFCGADYPEDLALALKRAVAIALTRANMGIIKNLCSINWIIDPLGATLEAAPEIAPSPPIYSDCDPHACNQTGFILRRSRDWIEGVGTGDVCDANKPLPHIDAAWDRGCDKPAGLPEQVWPGVLAAECIVRSMIHCPINLKREC